MAFKDLPDNQLVRLFKEGQEKAFNELFSRYFNKLHQFSLKYVKDASIAEELVLDLLLRVWQHSDHIRTDGEIGPYLFTAMKNTLLNQLRKKTLSSVSLDLTPETGLPVIAADEQLQTAELKAGYDLTLQQLSPQRKKVFQMSRDQEMSHKEIAAELNLSVNTVENHISASLKFLRGKLKKYTDVAFSLMMLFFLK